MKQANVLGFGEEVSNFAITAATPHINSSVHTLLRILSSRTNTAQAHTAHITASIRICGVWTDAMEQKNC